MQVLHPQRPDGTFVIQGPLGPYHVTQDDPLFGAVSDAYAALVEAGETLPPEPVPPPVIIPPQPPPTVADLLAQVQAIQAQLEAMQGE